jgi:hypothetical protein
MRREQEESLNPRGKNEVPTASDRAALRGSIDSDDCKPVHCPGRLCTEKGTIGALQKAGSVSLRMSDARGCDVQDPRHMSQVQDETGQETDR